MRAAMITGEGRRSLIVTTTGRPVPAADEVLIRVHTVGVNQLDLNVINGVGPGRAAERPRVVGIDPAGEILDQGSDVATDRVGERVVVKPNISCGTCRYCRAGEEADCPAQLVVGVHRDGGAAQLVAVPARNAFGIGDLSFATATAAVHSIPIALHAIEASGGVTAGDTVLVTGSSGAVGSAAAQIAAHRGATVITASRSPAPPDGSRQHLMYSDPTALGAALSTQVPAGVDLLVDATGHAGVVGAAVPSLRWRGRAVLCSASVSPDLQLDARAFYLKRLRLFGVASAHYDEVRLGLELARTGIVSTAVGATYPLARIDEAVRTVASGEARGKTIIQLV